MTMKAAPVNSHADRPAAKTLLPFRFVNDPVCGLVINYDALADDGQHIPCSRTVGDPESKSVKLYDPLSYNIWHLAQLYWEMEARQDALARERDELLTKTMAQQGAIQAAEKRAQELTARLEREGKESPPRRKGGD